MTGADLRVGRARFADGLLEEVQWWLLQTTDHLDATHPDRSALIAAAVQVEWLREQLSRLLATVRGEPVGAGSASPRSPNKLRGGHASLYQLHFLLGKVRELVGWLSGDDGRADGGWVDDFLWDLDSWDGHIGEMPGDDSLISIAVSILERIDPLQKWIGLLTLEDAVKALFPFQTTDELRSIFLDEVQTSPQLDWVRWMRSSTSEYTMPPVSRQAHGLWLSALLDAYADLAATIAEDATIEAADRDQLKAAAAYAAWLREGVQWDVAHTAATSAPPWVTPRALPTPQWPTTPPPGRPERLGQWHPAMSGLRELAREISWVRDRIWPNLQWRQEVNPSDPFNLTMTTPCPPALYDRW